MKVLLATFIIFQIGVIFLCGCKKEGGVISDQNPLKGKIKNIHQSYEDGREFDYTFYYKGNTHKLEKIVYKSDNEIESNVILTYSNNVIRIKEVSYPDMVVLHSWVILTDDNNKILSIKQFGTDYYTFLIDEGILSSLYADGIRGIVENISNYNISNNGENYVSVMHSYTIYFLGSPSFIRDRVNNYSFTSYINTHIIPLQNPVFSNIDDWVINPLYLSGIEGYQLFTPNKHLIEKKNNYLYEYTFNEEQQIINMFTPYTTDSISASQGDQTKISWTFTYY